MSTPKSNPFTPFSAKDADPPEAIREKAEAYMENMLAEDLDGELWDCGEVNATALGEQFADDNGVMFGDDCEIPEWVFDVSAQVARSWDGDCPIDEEDEDGEDEDEEEDELEEDEDE